MASSSWAPPRGPPASAAARAAGGLQTAGCGYPAGLRAPLAAPHPLRALGQQAGSRAATDGPAQASAGVSVPRPPPASEPMPLSQPCGNSRPGGGGPKPSFGDGNAARGTRGGSTTALLSAGPRSANVERQLELEAFSDGVEMRGMQSSQARPWPAGAATRPPTAGAPGRRELVALPAAATGAIGRGVPGYGGGGTVAVLAGGSGAFDVDRQRELEEGCDGVESRGGQRTLAQVQDEHPSNMDWFNRRQWVKDPFYGWRTQDPWSEAPAARAAAPPRGAAQEASAAAATGWAATCRARDPFAMWRPLGTEERPPEGSRGAASWHLGAKDPFHNWRPQMQQQVGATQPPPIQMPEGYKEVAAGAPAPPDAEDDEEAPEVAAPSSWTTLPPSLVALVPERWSALARGGGAADASAAGTAASSRAAVGGAAARGVAGSAAPQRPKTQRRLPQQEAPEPAAPQSWAVLPPSLVALVPEKWGGLVRGGSAGGGGAEARAAAGAAPQGAQARSSLKKAASRKAGGACW